MSTKIAVWLILLITSVSILAPDVGAAETSGRVALLINVSAGGNRREDIPGNFPKVKKTLEANFDRVILMDNTQAKTPDLIPSPANVKKAFQDIGNSHPKFLFVYYLGYGQGEGIAFDRQYLSRKVLWNWMQGVEAASFTIIDVFPSKVSDMAKATPILPILKPVQPGEPHAYLLLNRQDEFLSTFEEIISTSQKTGLDLSGLCRMLSRYLSGYDSLPEAASQIKGQKEMVIIPGASASLPEIKTETAPSKPAKPEPVKEAAVPKKEIPPAPPQIPPNPPFSKGGTNPPPFSKGGQGGFGIIGQGGVPEQKTGYFKRISGEPVISLLDLQIASRNQSDGQNIIPFLTEATLFGINAVDGQPVWKIPVDRACSEYGMNFADDKYIFAILQNEYDGSCQLKVIKRVTGEIAGSLQIWGNPIYYPPYQQRFVTLISGGQYISFVAMNKPNQTSEIRKIIFDPATAKLSSENYELDYLITSPLNYQPDLARIYWGGKRNPGKEVLLGSLDTATGTRKEYTLPPGDPAPGGDVNYAEYVIENPPLALPSGYPTLPHTLYFFVCLNKRAVLAKGSTDNLIAAYQLKNADGELEISRYTFFNFKGKIISSPAIFRDSRIYELCYVYFFSVIPPKGPDQTGMQNVLTVFKPYFWQKGMYLESVNHTLEGLTNQNLLGVPSVFKRDNAELMLMASDEVYIFNYADNTLGQKTWNQEYSYNKNTKSEMFYGISNSPIQQVNDLYLVKSTQSGRNFLYGFKLTENFVAPGFIPGLGNNGKPGGEQAPALRYGLTLAWIFEGGNSIDAALAYLPLTLPSSSSVVPRLIGELQHWGEGIILAVSRGKLFGINPASADKQPSVKWTASVPEYSLGETYEPVSASPTLYKDNLYWASLGRMFTANLAGLENTPPAPSKFSDISRKISTGIAFSGDKFCYGTENNGVEIFTLNKDSFYSFAPLAAKVSCTPVISGDMAYFATQIEKESYFYGVKLDSQGFFVLPHPAWDIQDKTFVSPDSWKFKIKEGRITARPVPGQIGPKGIIFAGTDRGMIYAFPQQSQGFIGNNGELTQPVWSYKLPRIDEGITIPPVFDEANNILYALSSKGQLYVLDPTRTQPVLATFNIAETDDYLDFKPTGMTLADGNLCFSAASKKLSSVFYNFNYKTGKYLRVPLDREAAFEPLVIANTAYVPCRGGEIYRINISAQ